MADDSIVFSLDLDSAEFMDKMGDAGKALAELAGQGKRLEALQESFAAIAGTLAVVAAAVMAFKLVLDAAIKTERIEELNKQFDVLAKQAGIAGDAMKDALKEAADGLIDDTDLIQIANRALITMGQSAEKLPQIMELARKATVAFGGDLQEKFELLQRAVESGNTRMLRQIGIIVDVDAAVLKYARNLGVTVDQVSEAGKRQAILNEVLSQGEKNFKGINTELPRVVDQWQRLKVATGQAFEAFQGYISRFNNSGIIKLLTQAAQGAELFFKRAAGGDRSTSEWVQVYSDRIAEIKQKLDEINSGKVGWFTKIFYWAGGGQESRAAKLTQELKEYEAALAKLQERQQMEQAGKSYGPMPADPSADAARKAAQKEEQVNQQKIAEDRAKTQVKALELEERRAQFILENSTSEQEAVNAAEALKQIHHQQELARIEELDVLKQNGRISDDEYNVRRQEIAIQSMEQQRELERQLEQERLMALERYAEANKRTAEGMAGAFRAAGASASRDLQNFNKQGKIVMTAFQNNAVSALQAWGAGTKTAAEAAKGFLFGMLADFAEAQGRLMMLAAFETFPAINVGKFAAGAALVALSGFLRSQAGGSAGLGGGVGGVGGGTGGFASGDAGAQREEAVEKSEAPKKAVTIQVQGSYFETEQTRRRLVEMIREESDATDFRLRQIGE